MMGKTIQILVFCFALHHLIFNMKLSMIQTHDVILLHINNRAC